MPDFRRNGILCSPYLLTILIVLILSALGWTVQWSPNPRAEVTNQPVAMIEDWSMRHVVYTQFGSMTAMLAAQEEPRAQFSWRRRLWAADRRAKHEDSQEQDSHDRFPPVRRMDRALQRDWSISLGVGGTPINMYPAKFSFDVNAVPSCANDFVVFPIAAKGSATQPNLAAFNNLYSGTAGGNGICNRTPGATDTGVAATVYWSYNVNGIGGSVLTSPALSLDGAKVAFVESVAGQPAHFHVLAWKSGDGQSAAKLQNVLIPKTINAFVTSAPIAGSGTATDLSLGAATTGTDTSSSVFVDFRQDVAYVGNDIGLLYRIKDVFCTLNAACLGATKPAPTLDATWGAGGVVTVGPGSCAGATSSVLTGPVRDGVTGNVFVGCSDGKLYGFNSTGQALTPASVIVGDGTASKTYGGIVDPPIVDSVNGFVYAVSGSASGGANGALVQAKTNFSSSVVARIGAGNQCNIHAPDLNNAYYTNPASAAALIYVAGVTGTVSQPCSPSSTTTGTITVYGVTFGVGGVMTAGAPAHSFGAGGGPGAEWAPLLLFFNPTTAVEWLFVGANQSNQTNMGSANVTAAFPAGIGAVVTEGLGPSGMIVDNDSASVQASSIYFTALQATATCTNNTNVNGIGGCAVKLTQSALQ
jgi:hypothetical protein